MLFGAGKRGGCHVFVLFFIRFCFVFSFQQEDWFSPRHCASGSFFLLFVLMIYVCESSCSYRVKHKRSQQIATTTTTTTDLVCIDHGRFQLVKRPTFAFKIEGSIENHRTTLPSAHARTLALTRLTRWVCACLVGLAPIFSRVCSLEELLYYY